MTPKTRISMHERIKPHRDHLLGEIETLKAEASKIDPRSKSECDEWSRRVYSNIIASKTRLLNQLYPQ